MTNKQPRGIAVVDVGFTNTKIALFSPAGEMLAELILALLGRLLTLLICQDLLVFALLQLLTVLVIDGPLSLQRKAAALLGNAGRDWPDAVP